MDVADGQSGAGWVLLDGTSCAPWGGRPGPFYLHEAFGGAFGKKVEAMVANGWSRDEAECVTLLTSLASRSLQRSLDEGRH